MAKTVRIDLDQAITGHKGPILFVTIREPRGGDILEIGEPVVIGNTGEGSLIIENDDKLRRYIERLTLDEDGRQIDPNLLVMTTAVDILRIRGAVLDFFMTARSEASKPLSRS